eukprot:8420046-Ditylum_brightwellii.AAC.1
MLPAGRSIWNPIPKGCKKQAAAAKACAAAAQAGTSNPTSGSTTPTPTGDTKSKDALPGGHTTASEVNTPNDRAAVSSAVNLHSTGCWAGG